jgi:hypothetical protein
MGEGALPSPFKKDHTRLALSKVIRPAVSILLIVHVAHGGRC